VGVGDTAPDDELPPADEPPDAELDPVVYAAFCAASLPPFSFFFSL
jgi:hypothetical protein